MTKNYISLLFIDIRILDVIEMKFKSKKWFSNMNLFNFYISLFLVSSIYLLLLSSCSENYTKNSISKTLNTQNITLTYYRNIEDSSKLIIEFDSFYLWSENIRMLLKVQDSFMLSYGKSINIFHLKNDTFYVTELANKMNKYVKIGKTYTMDTITKVDYQITTCLSDNFRKFRMPKLKLNFNLTYSTIENKISCLKYNMDEIDKNILNVLFNAIPIDKTLKLIQEDEKCKDNFDKYMISIESRHSQNKFYFGYQDLDRFESRLYLDIIFPYLQYKYNIGFVDYNTPLFTTRTDIIQIELK